MGRGAVDQRRGRAAVAARPTRQARRAAIEVVGRGCFERPHGRRRQPGIQRAYQSITARLAVVQHLGGQRLSRKRQRTREHFCRVHRSLPCRRSAGRAHQLQPLDASTTTPSAARTPWPCGQHEHRVDLGLDQALAELRRHLRERDDGVDQRLDIGLGPAAEAVEQRPGLQLLRHGERLVAAQPTFGRQQPHRRVLEQLGGHAAHAEQDGRAERIAVHAEDQLDAAADHLLHQEALRPHAGLRFDVGRHRVRRAPTVSGVRLTATPPTSVLCVISDDRIFSTTRPPSSRAAASASAGEVTIRSGAHGTPKRVNSSLACASSSAARREVVDGDAARLRRSLGWRLEPADLQHRAERRGAALGCRERRHAALASAARATSGACGLT